MAIALVHDFHLPSWLGHPVTLERSATHDRNQIVPWRLEVKHDPFTGAISCSLRAPRMSFDHGALTFQFSRSTDTFDAIYRIDAGQPFSWRISAMSLAAHGVQIQNDDPANPSGGRVIIPYNALIGGQTVWIRPGPKAAAWPFKIEGLTAELMAAKSQGCPAGFTGALSE